MAISVKNKGKEYMLTPSERNGIQEAVLFLSDEIVFSNTTLTNTNVSVRRKLQFVGSENYLVKIPTNSFVDFFNGKNRLEDNDGKSIGEIIPIFVHEGTKYFFGNQIILILDSADVLSDVKRSLKPISQCGIANTTIYLFKFKNYKKALKAYEKLGNNNINGVRYFDLNAYSFDNDGTFNQNIVPIQVFKDCKYKLPKQEAYESIRLHTGSERPLLGDPNIRIGIFDVGVDNDHPDLINSSDDRSGYDYVKGMPVAIPDKNQSHGTNCAGLIAGSSDGVNGVEGVAKNCALIDYRIGYQDGEHKFRIDLFALFQAFYKAALEDNISIINCSWGMSVPFETLEFVIDDIFVRGRNGKGTLIVASAGNSGKSSALAPAIFKNVIGVTGVDNCGVPVIKESWKSNFGTGCNVSAPSLDLITTSNSSDDCGNLYNYKLDFSGTSAAAPLISGALALKLSHDPDLTSSDLKEFITNSDNLTPYRPINYNDYGSGILNIKKLFEKHNL